MEDHEFPILSFPENWKIQMIPPFAGAAFRFQIIIDEHKFSVYYDVWNELGIMDESYFEVYPIDGDTYRCYKEEFHLFIQSVNDEVERLDSKKYTSLESFLSENPNASEEQIWKAAKNSL